MKYFKITLTKDENGLVYPANYQAEIGDKAASPDGHVYYTDEKGVTCLLLAVKDADATNIARTGVVEVSSLDAATLSTTYEDVITRFSDEAEVERIKIKVLRGQALTADEEKALDPDDDTVPGFTRTKRLQDRIADVIAAELSA